MITEQVVGQARSVIALCAKSENPKIREEGRKLRQNLHDNIILGTRLVSKNIIHTLNPYLGKILQNADKYDEKKAVLEVPKNEKDYNQYHGTEKLSEMLVAGQRASRAQHWRYRVTVESEEMARLGWFPLFVTLTVDQKRFRPSEVMESGAWNRFKARIFEKVRIAGGKRRDTPVSQYGRYFAVIESGDSGYHHHLHAVIWVRFLPGDISDPTCGGLYKRHVDIRPFSSFWEFGFAEVKAIWQTGACPWRKIGWVTPTPKGRPQKVSAPGATGAYICKYLDKQKDGEEWHYRTRNTRNLGLQEIQKVTTTLSVGQLILTQFKPGYDQVLAHSISHRIPMTLLRQHSRRELCRRSMTSLRLRSLLAKHSIRPQVMPFVAMQESVQDGHQPWLMVSRQRYEWLLSCLDPKTTGHSDKHEILSSVLSFFAPRKEQMSYDKAHFVAA